MTQFISLLRGINVAGQKKILMKDLKALYENLGFSHVVTYIQSGNVLFETSEADSNKLAILIHNQIKKHYGFEVPIAIRNQQQLAQIVDNCPIDRHILETEANRVMVTFLSAVPNTEEKQALLDVVIAPDEMIFLESELYFYCPNGFGKSKLTNDFIEHKLKLSATTRNWKTTNTLLKLCN